ncbi:MAG: hypothetical protein AB1847_19280 [bacterium]
MNLFEEPDAGNPHVRFREGREGKPSRLLDFVLRLALVHDKYKSIPFFHPFFHPYGQDEAG